MQISNHYSTTLSSQSVVIPQVVGYYPRNCTKVEKLSKVDVPTFSEHLELQEKSSWRQSYDDFNDKFPPKMAISIDLCWFVLISLCIWHGNQAKSMEIAIWEGGFHKTQPIRRVFFNFWRFFPFKILF